MITVDPTRPISSTSCDITLVTLTTDVSKPDSTAAMPKVSTRDGFSNHLTKVSMLTLYLSMLSLLLNIAKGVPSRESFIYYITCWLRPLLVWTRNTWTQFHTLNRTICCWAMTNPFWRSRPLVATKLFHSQPKPWQKHQWLGVTLLSKGLHTILSTFDQSYFLSWHVWLRLRHLPFNWPLENHTTYHSCVIIIPSRITHRSPLTAVKYLDTPLGCVCSAY